MYLKNAWYVGAWAEEVGRELMTRTICEEPVLFYRKEDGEPVAIGNLCPHRFAPLDRGRLNGDTVQCGYHGMVFGETGQCVLNPHHGGHIAPAMKVKSYPVVERHAMVWLWLGDPDLADAALIPDFSCHDDPNFVNVHGVIEMAANYELITDNLLDLTHGEFLHEGILSSEAITISKLESLEIGNTVWANRWCPNGAPAPIFGKLMQELKAADPAAPVDHWLYMRWDAPAHMLLDVGVTKPNGNRDEGIWNYGTDIMTPIDQTHSYYFWAVSRNQAIERQDISDFFRSSIERAFADQDQPMIEAQQRVLGDRSIGDLSPVALPADISLAKARRALRRLMASEAEGGVPRPGHSPLTELIALSATTHQPVAPVV